MDDNCCKVNESSKNPNGQRATMQGTTSTSGQKTTDLNQTTYTAIDASGSLGVKRFEKD